MGKVLPLLGPILINGQTVDGDDPGVAVEKKLREAIDTIRANGYRRIRVEISVRGIERSRSKVRR